MNAPASNLAQDLDDILEQTRDLWDDLRGGHLFITGGTGFVGCWMLESFTHANDRLKLNAKATVLTRDQVCFQEKAPRLCGHPSVETCQGDVRDFQYPGSPFSHIIHGATNVVSPERNPLDMFDTIVGGTRRVLDLACETDAQKFLLLSSGAVYGKLPSGLEQMAEDNTNAPKPEDHNVYGEGKRVAELLLGIYARSNGLEATVARCFSFVGPYLPMDAHFAIGNFIRDGLSGRTIQVKGDGRAVRSYLYASDLAVWLWTILFRGEPGRAYNVGSDRAISIKDLAYTVAGCFSPPPEVRIENQNSDNLQSNSYVPFTDRAQQELGLKQTVDLTEAIRKCIAFHHA